MADPTKEAERRSRPAKLPRECDCGGRLEYEISTGYISVWCSTCTPVMEVSVRTPSHTPAPGAEPVADALTALYEAAFGAVEEMSCCPYCCNAETNDALTKAVVRFERAPRTGEVRLATPIASPADMPEEI